MVFDLLSLLAALTAFGVHVTTATVVTAYAVVALVSLVPVTPGGLGLVEGGLFALLLVRGVPAASLMAGVLTYRLVSYWLVVLMGGVALMSERVVSARSGSGSGSTRVPQRSAQEAARPLAEDVPRPAPRIRLPLRTVQRRTELPRQSPDPASALPH